MTEFTGAPRDPQSLNVKKFPNFSEGGKWLRGLGIGGVIGLLPLLIFFAHHYVNLTEIPKIKEDVKKNDREIVEMRSSTKTEFKSLHRRMDRFEQKQDLTYQAILGLKK